MRAPDRRRTILAAIAVSAIAAGCRDAARDERPPRPVQRAAVETVGAGWIRVDAGGLIGAGLDADTPVAALSLSREGRPVSFLVEKDEPTLGEAEAVLFWAEPATSRWSDTAVYWVAGGEAEGVRIGSRQTGTADPAPDALRAVQRTAPEQFYVLSLQNGPETNFVWDGVVATTGPAAKDFVVAADHPTPGGTFSLLLELHGLSEDVSLDPDHHVIVEVNGHQAGDVTFDGLGDHDVALTGPGEWIVPGDNLITLRLPHDTGASRDTVLVRAITLDHPRLPSTDTPDEVVVVVAGAAGAYVLDGVPPATAVYDLSDPYAPVRLDGAGDGSPPVPSGIQFIADSAPMRLLLVPPEASRPPLAVRPPRGRAPSAAHRDASELLVVAPADLAPAAERLADHRRSQGISVSVLLWEEVVDAYGEGLPSPDAIAMLVREARWPLAPPPRWLLLFGDASHDPKELLSEDGPSGNRIPTFFDDAAGLMEAPSDNGFVADDPRSHPTLAVGRIPAVDLAEADAVVDKLLAYDAAQAPPFASKVVFAADDGTTAWEIALFEETSAAAAAMLPPSLSPVPVYVGALGAAAARTALLDEISGGALWVNYLGHGGYTEWAAESIFTDEDIAALPEHDVLPVYAVMNCLSGHFSQPNWKLRSLGEQLLLAPDKGAIAVIASSALAYPGGQPELDLHLVQRLLVDTEAPTIGEALREAKLQLDPTNPEHGDVILAWNLLGDPSMRLKRP